MAKLEIEGEARVTRLDRLVLAERLSGVDRQSGRYMRAILMRTRRGWVVRRVAKPAGYEPPALPAQAAKSRFFGWQPAAARGNRGCGVKG